MQKKRDPRGRKPIEDEPFDEQVIARLSSKEKVKLIRLSEELGMTTSALVRLSIVRLLDSEIGEYWPSEQDQESKD